MGATETHNFYEFGIFGRVPEPQNQKKNQEKSLEHFKTDDTSERPQPVGFKMILDAGPPIQST